MDRVLNPAEPRPEPSAESPGNGAPSGTTGRYNRGPRRPRGRVVSTAAALGTMVAILVVSATVMSLFPGSRSGPASNGSSGGAPPSPVALPPNVSSPDGERCNAVSSPTPSAVLIPEAAPAQALPAGGHLTAQFEFAVLNVPASSPEPTIRVPSLTATFPLASGSTVSVYFAPENYTASGSGWESPATASQSMTASSSLEFANRPAVLSSAKLAVTADTSYGNATLEVRWQWTETPPGSGGTSGGWSVPTEQADWPSATPSIFFPAPFVTLLASAPQPATIGTEYTVELSGDVAGRYIYLEIETPSTGTLERSNGATAPGGLTGPYTAEIPLLNWDDYLYPGTYLLHVHDACGALLYSFPVATVYAPSADVLLETRPSSCGAITFDGSSYFPGSTARVAPASTPYSYSIPSCAPYSFRGWNSTGGLHVAGSGELLVSASGTFTFDFA